MKILREDSSTVLSNPLNNIISVQVSEKRMQPIQIKSYNFKDNSRPYSRNSIISQTASAGDNRSSIAVSDHKFEKIIIKIKDAPDTPLLMSNVD